MNIQKIDVLDKHTIVITDESGHSKEFKRSELDVPETVWLDNIISCSMSLMMKTPE